MTDEDLWEQAVELKDRLFEVTTSISVPKGDYWPTLVTVCLDTGNRRLRSIGLLLEPEHDDYDGAVILMRSLFELEVTLSYINQDVPGRLKSYLRHGKVALAPEEVKQIDAKLESGGLAPRDLVPNRPWKNTKEMCTALGRNDEYDTLYRLTSVHTHAGAFTLGEKAVRLFTSQDTSARDKATVLLTAISSHLEIAGIAGDTFPSAIDIGTIGSLGNRCNELGWSLAKALKS